MSEQFHPHTNTKKWLVGIGIAVIVAGIAVAVYFVFFHKAPKPAPAPYNPYKERVQSLETQTPPTDPLQQAIYYGQIAQNYQQVNDSKPALDNFLKAQHVIDDHKLTDQYVFYQAIADTYVKTGDKAKAKHYYELQLAYYKAYLAQHPDDISTPQAIKAVEQQIQKL